MHQGCQYTQSQTLVIIANTDDIKYNSPRLGFVFILATKTEVMVASIVEQKKLLMVVIY